MNEEMARREAAELVRTYGPDLASIEGAIAANIFVWAKRWNNLWDMPDMRDPRRDESLEEYWMQIPYRGEWVVPGVIIRLIKRARAEGSGASEIPEIEKAVLLKMSNEICAMGPLKPPEILAYLHDAWIRGRLSTHVGTGDRGKIGGLTIAAAETVESIPPRSP